MKIFNVKDKLPNVERGSYLVYAPQSFPKNSRWVVAEYYEDAKGFYSESDEVFMKDVTHWCELPKEPCEGRITNTNKNASPIHDVSGNYWLLLDKASVPPIIYGGVVPCFTSRKLAQQAKSDRINSRGWKIKKININYH